MFISIMINHLSQVFRYEEIRWYAIIPDSYCGMTSLVLSLAVIFGKKDNCVLHFTWLLGIFGGISTVIYATFVGQGPTIFLFTNYIWSSSSSFLRNTCCFTITF